MTGPHLQHDKGAEAATVNVFDFAEIEEQAAVSLQQIASFIGQRGGLITKDNAPAAAQDGNIACCEGLESQLHVFTSRSWMIFDFSTHLMSSDFHGF